MLSQLPTRLQSKLLHRQTWDKNCPGARCRTIDVVAADKAVAPNKNKAKYGKDRGHNFKETRPARCGLESRGGQLCMNTLLGYPKRIRPCPAEARKERRLRGRRLLGKL